MQCVYTPPGHQHPPRCAGHPWVLGHSRTPHPQGRPRGDKGTAGDNVLAPCPFTEGHQPQSHVPRSAVSPVGCPGCPAEVSPWEAPTVSSPAGKLEGSPGSGDPGWAAAAAPPNRGHGTPKPSPRGDETLEPPPRGEGNPKPLPKPLPRGYRTPKVLPRGHGTLKPLTRGDGTLDPESTPNLDGNPRASPRARGEPQIGHPKVREAPTATDFFTMGQWGARAMGGSPAPQQAPGPPGGPSTPQHTAGGSRGTSPALLGFNHPPRSCVGWGPRWHRMGPVWGRGMGGPLVPTHGNMLGCPATPWGCAGLLCHPMGTWWAPLQPHGDTFGSCTTTWGHGGLRPHGDTLGCPRISWGHAGLLYHSMGTQWAALKPHGDTLGSCTTPWGHTGLLYYPIGTRWAALQPHGDTLGSSTTPWGHTGLP